MVFKTEFMRVIISLVIVILIVGAGCKPKKLLIEETAGRTTMNEFKRQWEKVVRDFHSVSLRFSAKVAMDEERYNLTGSMRIRMDSILWISARSTIGLEMFRLMANKDSIWIYSRLLHFEDSGSWGDMAKYIGYPVGFNTVQDVLTGSISGKNNDNNWLKGYTISNQQSGLKMIAPDTEIKVKAEKNGRFLSAYTVSGSPLVVKENRLRPTTGLWKFIALYEEYQEVGGFLFPLRYSIEAMDQTNTMDGIIRYSMVQMNTDLKFPFRMN